MRLGKFGTAHQLYIPWMQASYIMVANREALSYLPAGADINALSYDQLASWASAIQEKTGRTGVCYFWTPVTRPLVGVASPRAAAESA
jgi:hypothetical protein